MSNNKKISLILAAPDAASSSKSPTPVPKELSKKDKKMLAKQQKMEDIKIIVDVKKVIQNNEQLAETLDKLSEIDEYVEKSVSKLTRLSTKLSNLSSRASSLSTVIPGTPNLQLIPAIQQTPISKNMKQNINSSFYTTTSDDRLTTCSLLARNITESITRLSLTHSLSSFNVSAPFGPLPIVTPASLIGLPIKHIDLKTVNIDICNTDILPPTTPVRNCNLDESPVIKQDD